MTKYFFIKDHSDAEGACFTAQEVRPVMLTFVGLGASFSTRAHAERYVREQQGVLMETEGGPYCPWPRIEGWKVTWADYPLNYDGPTFGNW